MCQFERTGRGLRCPACGLKVPDWPADSRPPHSNCTPGPNQSRDLTEATPGPGASLKAMLKLIGIVAEPGCSCNARAKHMDAMGCQWCRQNIELILEWLSEEAAKRRLAFPRAVAKGVVLLAIRRAEKAAERRAKRGPGPT